MLCRNICQKYLQKEKDAEVPKSVRRNWMMHMAGQTLSQTLSQTLRQILSQTPKQTLKDTQIIRTVAAIITKDDQMASRSKQNSLSIRFQWLSVRLSVYSLDRIILMKITTAFIGADVRKRSASW